MTTRKALNDGEQDFKRRRIEDASNAEIPASLDSVNDDCLLRILSSLPTDDLNTVAVCNRRFRLMRDHVSLDQTRMGTIMISEGTTIVSLLSNIIENQWSKVFTGNRTHLRIDGVENIRGLRRYNLEEGRQADRLVPRATIEGVTRLDFSQIPNHDNNDEFFWSLCRILPNLADLDLSLAGFPYLPVALLSITRTCRRLTRVTWKGCAEPSLSLSGMDFDGLPILSELNLDDSFFRRLVDVVDPGNYMFQYCRRLERLSIKNAKYKSDDEEIHPLSQEMLIKMVRHHPTLRWLRSDLSEENIAMLQQERPEITLVRE